MTNPKKSDQKIAPWQLGLIVGVTTTLIGLFGMNLGSLMNNTNHTTTEVPSTEAPNLSSSPSPTPNIASSDLANQATRAELSPEEVIRNNSIQTIPPTVSPPESIPHTPEKKSKNNSSNSSNVAFPKSSCGDPLPENPQAYPINFYPVFIDYNENNLSVVRARFCGDALKKTREKTGKLAIQVSSFTSINRAESFKNLMKEKFGSGEVGEPTVVKKSKN